MREDKREKMDDIAKCFCEKIIEHKLDWSEAVLTATGLFMASANAAKLALSDVSKRCEEMVEIYSQGLNEQFKP